MDEKEFAEELKETLITKFSPKYSITTKEPIIYKVIVDDTGNFNPRTPEKPSRGNLAFETDILIKKNNIPLVVIETKYGGFSTHDVLTYSNKALKHKEVYPYLRYGFIVGNTKIIQNRFFTHNTGFDFAMALDHTSKNELDKFIEVITKQIESSEKLLNILSEKNATKLFNSVLELELVNNKLK